MDEAIRGLRAVRRFLPDDIPGPVLERIVDAARWTGSARNRQPWRFVAVTNPQVRNALSGFGGYAVHLATAPLVLVLASRDNGFSDTEFDMGRLTQSVCLIAAAHGLGSCPTTLHPAANVARAAELLRLDAGWLPRHAIALGYPDPAAAHSPTAIPQGRRPIVELLTWLP
ncbi:nitroreductase family protein [Nocardia sp. NPDC088792]|uniref:nitroreductase family protein n=1 Tax=Nocardia sp. NPDC088792 TaxID=3364332 RepID=UPI003815F784